MLRKQEENLVSEGKSSQALCRESSPVNSHVRSHRPLLRMQIHKSPSALQPVEGGGGAEPSGGVSSSDPSWWVCRPCVGGRGAGPRGRETPSQVWEAAGLIHIVFCCVFAMFRYTDTYQYVASPCSNQYSSRPSRPPRGAVGWAFQG